MTPEQLLGLTSGITVGALIGLAVVAAFLFMIAFTFLHFISNMLSVLRDIDLKMAGLGHVGNTLIKRITDIDDEVTRLRILVEAEIDQDIDDDPDEEEA